MKKENKDGPGIKGEPFKIKLDVLPKESIELPTDTKTDTRATVPYKYKAFVTKVIDGDTIRVDIDLGFGVTINDRIIRFANIDTPEIRGEEREQGLVSKAFVNSMIPAGSDIIIETFKDKKGKYGRYIANIILLDGEILNNILLEKKLAVSSNYTSNKK